MMYGLDSSSLSGSICEQLFTDKVSCIGNMLQDVLSAAENDAGLGIYRNCGVRSADSSDGKCGICRTRGY